MKNILILALFVNICIADSRVYGAFALAIYDKNMNKEEIQNKRETTKNYQGICFSEVFINYTKNNPNVKVTIGNSIGHEIFSKAIYKNNIKVGKIIRFKHYAVDKGYLSVKINNQIFSKRIFIK